MIISSTLIKRLFFKGEERQFLCPKKEYHHILKGDIKEPPSEAMIRGLLFESICFRDKEAEEYYERKLRLNKGGQSVHTQRIYDAARMFDIVANKYEISIEDTQVPLHGTLEIERFEHIKFSLKGTADIITPINSPGFGHNKAVIDVKLTMEFTDFGEYCWNSPQFMDHTQAVLYSYLSGLPFAYLINSYSSKARGHKMIPIATPQLFPNGQPDDLNKLQHYNVAKDRFTDFKVVIKDVAHKVLKWHAEGFPSNPSFEACKHCPLNPLNYIDMGIPVCDNASFTEII